MIANSAPPSFSVGLDDRVESVAPSLLPLVESFMLVMMQGPDREPR